MNASLIYKGADEVFMQLSKSLRRKLSLSTREQFIRVATQQGMMIIGAILAAAGYVLFQVPYQIAAGGVTGLGIVVNHVSGFPVSYFFFLSNIPLFILGYYFLGHWRFIWSSGLAVLIFSISAEVLLQIAPALDPYPITQDSLLASIYAGVLVGIGTGIIYRYGGTVGGTSILARIINDRTGLPMSQCYLYTDLIIIIGAGLLISLETSLLALITLVLVGIFSDFVIEGTSHTRVLTIVTKHPEPLRDAIMYQLRRGVSHWEITGGYSGEKRTMLYLTVLRSKIYDVKFIISRIDPEAFVVVGVSQQTWGGFDVRRSRLP